MEEFKFEASDFDWVVHCNSSHPDIAQHGADIINAKLKEYLDKCPTVYALQDYDGKVDCWFSGGRDKAIKECKLFNIKTIREGK